MKVNRLTLSGNAANVPTFSEHSETLLRLWSEIPLEFCFRQSQRDRGKRHDHVSAFDG